MAVSGGVVILLASFSLVGGNVTNVAFMKHAWMSSLYRQGYPASKAVDGDSSSNSIVATNLGQSTAWWKVDLQIQVQSARVILYFRTTYIPRRNGVQLYTSGTNSSDPKEGILWYTVTGRPDGTGIPDVLNLTCPGTWRYLTVYTETNNDGGGALLDFAEVQVWTCSAGLYGVNCDKVCNSRNCNGSTECDTFTGACSSGICQIGWKGTDCAVCVDGKYGPNCARDCSSRNCKVFSSTCGNITGTCPAGGCKKGWIGVDCSIECTSGTYGTNCNNTCGYCSNNATCYHVTGICADGCEAGWQGDLCQKVLLDCPVGRYGQGCTEFCNSRNCKTPSPMCDVTGSCADGCREGWQNTDCRIPCPSGKYGSNCSKSCDSRQCKTARTACDHVSGACTSGCQEGWIGVDCTQRCKPGTYGPGCSRCGYCDVTCNVGDGRCAGECLDGFTGDRCDVDLRESVVKIGVIGGAIGVTIGIAVTLLLACGLLKHGRLQWSPSNGAEATEGRKTGTGYTEGISTRAPTAGVKDPDYTELNIVTREREEQLAYDVTQDQVYENNQI